MDNNARPLDCPFDQTLPYPEEKVILLLLSPKVNEVKGNASPKSAATHDPVPNKPPIPR